MRSACCLLLFLAVSAAPLLAQSDSASYAASAPAATAALPADALNPSVDYAALRDRVARENKILTDQVATARAIVKKNQELLKEAQKLQAANLKLAAQKRKLQAQALDLDRQREALMSAQKTDSPGSN